jgi:hypothetical protein
MALVSIIQITNIDKVPVKCQLCSSPDPNQQLRVDTSAVPELLAYSSNSLMAELTS